MAFDDVSFNENFSMMYIRVQSSKTDPFRLGTTIRLAAFPHHLLCPVLAMRRFLDFRLHTTGPLFTLRSGYFLNRRSVVAFFRISFRAFPILQPQLSIGGRLPLPELRMNLHVEGRVGLVTVSPIYLYQQGFCGVISPFYVFYEIESEIYTGLRLTKLVSPLYLFFFP